MIVVAKFPNPVLTPYTTLFSSTMSSITFLASLILYHTFSDKAILLLPSDNLYRISGVREQPSKYTVLSWDIL